MMPTSLPDAWNSLRSQQPSQAPKVDLLLLASIDEARLFAAVTPPHGLPGLFLDLPEAVKTERFRPLLTRAFRMTAPDVTGLPAGRWAILIALGDVAFADLFQALADDILNSALLQNDASSVLGSTIRCVERWIRFLERRSEPLSHEEVRGLIGELVILCRCTTRFGADKALTAWVGPDRALHDFELPDASVEVKSHQGDDSAAITIARPDQLDPVEPRPLYLAAVRLTASESLGLSLAAYVERAGAIIGSHYAEDFADRLAAAGYLPAHATLYPQKLVAGPIRLFHVGPAFPRIRSSEVPHGVVNVRFQVTLSALAAFGTEASPIVGVGTPEMEHSA